MLIFEVYIFLPISNTDCQEILLLHIKTLKKITNRVMECVQYGCELGSDQIVAPFESFLEIRSHVKQIFQDRVDDKDGGKVSPGNAALGPGGDAFTVLHHQIHGVHHHSFKHPRLVVQWNDSGHQ